MAKEMIFKIFRYNPDSGSKPFYQEYKVEISEGMTILDALHKIRETQDPTIAMRFSCRMAVCGSCGMFINGRATLACNTQVFEISDTVITLAPLPNYEVIKDLVPDLRALFEKHASMKPYIINDEDNQTTPKEEFYQSEADLLKYMQFAYCIKCGCCLSACPTVATDSEYPGPMSLAQGYRYSIDNRDQGFEQRKETIGTSSGVFRCHYAGECSNVCPKGVDPAKAVQFMKRMLVQDLLGMLAKKEPCKCLGKDPSAKLRDNIPKAPEFTVK